MDRTIINSLEQMRDFDFVSFERDVLKGLGFFAQDVLSGSPISVIGGLGATSNNTLVIALAPGRVYTVAQADATAAGSITQDTSLVVQQGQNSGQNVTLTAPSAGQSQWNLIQCQFSQVDAVRTGDPNGGLVPFYNAANPAVPNTQNISTVRRGLCVIQVISGSAATTGSEVPPNPTVGWSPLYLIDLAGGQSQISQAQIKIAGPSVGTGVPANYPSAPILAGFLAPHHGGIAGQAPKINLTSGTEVQGILPYINMSAVRTLLSSPLSVFVNTATGNDANLGTSPGSPFKTIQAAINAVSRLYDFNGNSCTINVANGTYAVSGSTAAAFNTQPLGASSLALVGNTASPGSVTIAVTNGSGIVATGAATVAVSGFTITATGSAGAQTGYGVLSGAGGRIAIGTCVVGSCGTGQLNASSGGILSTNAGPITLTGTTVVSLNGGQGGAFISIDGSTITVTGLTCSAQFAGVTQCCVISAIGNTFIGTLTGARYSANANGVIFTNGAGAAYFPSATVGSTATGGQYI